MNSRSTLKFYRKIRYIDGWFSKEMALIIALFDHFQKQNMVTGNIFEIGVHHGKSTIFLSHLLDRDEHLDICDIFDSQESNISNSGKGNKQIFDAYFDRLSPGKIRELFIKSSSSVSKDSLKGKFRLVHIDGGHSKEEALGDLELCAQVLHEKGIIILDDIFRSDWPGVTEALLSFCGNNPEFNIMALGFNKAFITRAESTTYFQKCLSNESKRSSHFIFKRYGFKKLTIANSAPLIFTPKSNPLLVKIKFKISEINRNIRFNLG